MAGVVDVDGDLELARVAERGLGPDRVGAGGQRDGVREGPARLRTEEGPSAPKGPPEPPPAGGDEDGGEAPCSAAEASGRGRRLRGGEGAAGGEADDGEAEAPV